MNTDKADLGSSILTPESRAEAGYFAEMDMESEPDDESLCPECEGDGGDKWNDYCLPCPTCGGAGRLW